MTPGSRTTLGGSASSLGRIPERVVLVSEDGTPVGTADKATVHTSNTPLHRAFSVHLRCSDGRVLLTRRALDKATWPGVWTNAVCGHPAPEEGMEEAILRRMQAELNLDPGLLSVPVTVLPHFRYRAVDASGIVENELCPVHLLDYAGDPEQLPAPEPTEVMDSAWVPWADLRRVGKSLPMLLSPWLVDQLGHDDLDRSVTARSFGT